MPTLSRLKSHVTSKARSREALVRSLQASATGRRETNTVNSVSFAGDRRRAPGKVFWPMAHHLRATDAGRQKRGIANSMPFAQDHRLRLIW